jgi:hypothetical protein
VPPLTVAGNWDQEPRKLGWEQSEGKLVTRDVLEVGCEYKVAVEQHAGSKVPHLRVLLGYVNI